MAIRFLCPNGHKIHCPENHVGQKAKCPQCGVVFVVPPEGEAQAAKLDGESSKSGSHPRPREPKIEFLCPNGHRLHGPASLQGKLGQCPECGSKFHIPAYDDFSDDEEPAPNLDIGLADERSAEELPLEVTSGSVPEALAASPPEALSASSAAEIQNPWALLVADLWRQRGDHAALHIELSDGHTVTPERFAFAHSTGEYGIFAQKESDGTFSVVAVAWSAVVQVRLQGMKHVPRELFEP